MRQVDLVPDDISTANGNPEASTVLTMSRVIVDIASLVSIDHRQDVSRMCISRFKCTASIGRCQ